MNLRISLAKNFNKAVRSPSLKLIAQFAAPEFEKILNWFKMNTASERSGEIFGPGQIERYARLTRFAADEKLV
jgi:hypothetical protein